MTREQFDEICRVTCPKCAAGEEPRQRLDTAEWTHTKGQGTVITHSLCLASGFRNSRFAKEVTGG